jgi:hypothetical protein
VFLRSLNLESIKNGEVYLLKFQWSAGGAQEGDRILCSWGFNFAKITRFGAFYGAKRVLALIKWQVS